MPDAVELRPWQLSGESATKQLVAYLKDMEAKRKLPTIKEKALVLWLDPGMGKSLLYMHCLNYLFRIEFIQRAAIYTPRLNLCIQAELSWKNEYSRLYQKPMMGPINHSLNGSGLLVEPNQFGFISTYQSLVANRKPPAIAPFNEHAAIFDKYPTALVVDEAQLLGFHGLTQERGISTEYIELIAARAKIVFVLTGTPLRADDKRITMAHYSDPDEEGRVFLEPAVRASYLDGVKHGSLRPFEFELFNGKAIYQYLDGEQEYLELASMNAGLEKIIENRGYWSRAVDITVEKVRAIQQAYALYCGLIACATQNQAKEVLAYIKEAHPKIKALLAISDEALAKDNLRQFQMGGFDILVTVAMAHIGYDYKPISVICCLTSVRNEGWLRQLFGRGWRWDKDAPPDQQVFVIAPDDPKMQKVVNQLRRESNDGMIEREPRIIDEKIDREQPRLGMTVSSQITTARAIGMDEQTDVSVDEYPGLVEAAKTHGLRAAPLTGLKGFLLSYGALPTASKPEVTLPVKQTGNMLNDNEIRAVLRQGIQDLARRADRIAREKGIAEPDDYAFTYTEMVRRFNGERIDDKLSKEKLEKRRDWIQNFWLSYLEQR